MISGLFGKSAGLSLAWLVLGLARSSSAIAPANDGCAGATVIPSAGPFPYYSSTVDVRDATTVNDPPLPGCRSVSVGRSVWYRFTPSATRLYTISVSKDTATTVLDTVMAVYTSAGACNGPFAEVHCNDDQEEETRSAISVTLNANVTYYIVVWMSSLSPPVSGLTSLQLRVSQPITPANDVCAGAEVIPGNGPFPYLTGIADTTLATTPGDPPAPSCWSDHARSVWFRFTPAAMGTYEFSLCTNTATTVYETVMAIYTSPNGCSGPLTPLACNHTNFCGNKPRSTITVALAKDTTYYIVAWEGVNTPSMPGQTSLQLRVSAFLPPIAITLPASDVTSSSAVLNGSVEPLGRPTTAWFEWGPNFSYTSTPIEVTGTGGVVGLWANIGGLQPGQTHHFRAAASNSVGTIRGVDCSFAWSSVPPNIDSFARTKSGYTLELTGQAGQMYLIEGSMDLMHWTNLGPANDFGAGNFRFSDATNLGSRFYRARSN